MLKEDCLKHIVIPYLSFPPHSHQKVQIDVKGDGSIDFSNFVPSGTWDVSSGVGYVNHYTVPSLPHEMATSRYRNKTDVTFNILVRRKVIH